MAIQKAVKQAAAEVNFGDISMYVAGAAIAEGNYALEFLVMNEQETENYKPKVPRIGVQVTAHSISDPKEVKSKFLSMGSKAHETFAPNPETGKGLVLKAGVQGGGTIPSSCNWALFLKSMYDCGLPQGIFTNDVSVLDGVHVHLANVPESEERRGFKNKKAATSEVEEEPKFDGPRTTLSVTEILEGGAPWEGGGGIPDADATPAPAPKTVGKVAPKPIAGKPAAKAPVAAAAVVGDEEIMASAINGVTAVIEKNPNGVGKIILRTGTFKAVSAADGDEMAQAVIDTFFGSDDALNTVIEQLGYKVEGIKVVPA